MRALLLLPLALLAAAAGFFVGQRPWQEGYNIGFSDGAAHGAADQWEHDKGCFMTDAGREAWLRARPKEAIVQ